MDDKTLVERLQEREHHFRHASEGEYDANLFMKARFEIEAQAEVNKALQSRIEALEAALREAPAALNAMAAQVDAEWRDHDKAAAKHDLVVRGFREKVRHLLEGKAHEQ